MNGLSKIPVIQVLVSNAVAAVNGLLASTDVNAGRTAMSKQRSLLLKGGAIGGGIILALVDGRGKFIEVSDGLIVGGTVLTTNELAFRIAQSSKGASAVAPQGYRAAVAPAGSPGVAAPLARGYKRQQAPGVFG